MSKNSISKETLNAMFNQRAAETSNPVAAEAYARFNVAECSRFSCGAQAKKEAENVMRLQSEMLGSRRM